MMFVLGASPAYSPLPRAPVAAAGGAIRTVTRPSASGPSASGVDVVGDQPRMPVEDLGQGLVDGPEQRVDRAVALGDGAASGGPRRR